MKKPDGIIDDLRELTIIEPVGVNDTTKLTVNNYVELQQEEKSIIFLMDNQLGNYALINDNLGKFSLADDPTASLQSLRPEEIQTHMTFRETVLEKYDLR